MLADLDELVQGCRDDRARAYIREAVACYKANAYRSAIVSTWVAVAFDIVDKIYELSVAGDKEATAFTEEFQAIMEDRNPVRMLNLERDLLKIARDKFELISAQEFTDLDRLREDRHKCAHPTRSSYPDIFHPTAELARTHIRTAVESLLKHEPTQGKAALENLVRDVKSRFFPPGEIKALEFLEKSALGKARASLIRNFVVVTLKSTLSLEIDHATRMRFRIALTCAIKLHGEKVIAVLREELTKRFRGLDSSDHQLGEALTLLLTVPQCLEVLDKDQIYRMEEFVRKMPTSWMVWIDDAINVPAFREAGRFRAKYATREEIESDAFFVIPIALMDRVIDGYCTAISFNSANAWGKLIVANAGELDPNDARKILTAAAANAQILGSFGLPAVIAALRKHVTAMPKEEMDALVRKVEEAKAGPQLPVQVGADDDIPF
jgi:hypothetical protein